MADNTPLSPKPSRPRRRRPKSNEEFGKVVASMIRAYGRRLATADAEDLPQLIALKDTVDQAVEDAVHGIRENAGSSWTSIGDALGITRQAARQRYHR